MAGAALAGWVRIRLLESDIRAAAVQRMLAREAGILAAVRHARPDGQYEVMVPQAREQEARLLLAPRRRAP